MGSYRYLVPILVTFGCAVPNFSVADTGNWIPTLGQVAEIERDLTLPRGAFALSEYARYYWGETHKGMRRIRGTLVYGQKIGIHLRDKAVQQNVTDQGCRWVFVTYDPQQKKPNAKCDFAG